MNKQISFSDIESNFSSSFKIQKSYGGSLGLGKRKTRRPLDSKKPLHLVLKATNSYTLLNNKVAVEQIIHLFSVKFGIKLHAKAVQHDHIHLCLSFQNRRIYTMWIRAVTGSLVQRVTGLKFKFLPFTRIINSWRNDFRSVQNYIAKNQAEAEFLLRVHTYIDARRERLFTELRLFANLRGGIFLDLMAVGLTQYSRNSFSNETSYK